MGNLPSEYDLQVIANAVEWTCVRGIGRNRTVTRHPNQADARLSATGDRRSMIYAVDGNGLSVHVENL